MSAFLADINLDRSRLKGTRENYKFLPSPTRLFPINNRDFLEILPARISADMERKDALPAESKRKLKRDHCTRADGRMDDGGAKCEKRRAYAIPEQADRSGNRRRDPSRIVISNFGDVAQCTVQDHRSLAVTKHHPMLIRFRCMSSVFVTDERTTKKREEKRLDEHCSSRRNNCIYRLRKREADRKTESAYSIILLARNFIGLEISRVLFRLFCVDCFDICSSNKYCRLLCFALLLGRILSMS